MCVASKAGADLCVSSRSAFVLMHVLKLSICRRLLVLLGCRLLASRSALILQMHKKYTSRRAS